MSMFWLLDSIASAIRFYYQMLKAKGRNFDNVSIAQTKSSKTLKSKLNANPEVEVKKFNPPYFKEENIYKEIEERAKKENSRFSGLLVKKIEYNHLDKAHQIVQDLFNRHQVTKQKLAKLKEESQKQTQIVCPFQPQRKRLEKFVVGGDVIRRNETWLIQKRRKSMMRKEENLESDLSQCTFTPNIGKSKSKSKDHSKSTFAKPRQGPCQSQSPLKPAHSQSRHKDLSKSTFETAKRDIFNRILTMT